MNALSRFHVRYFRKYQRQNINNSHFDCLVSFFHIFKQAWEIFVPYVISMNHKD